MNYKHEGKIESDLLKSFTKIGTIDIRIDYVRPGRGLYFIADSEIIRAGNKVTVTRMHLYNDSNSLIAVGTGTYIVG